MSDQWLSIVEYARTYNVSDMTVRRRIKTGKLQAVLREGKYYIPVLAETPWRTPQPQPQPQQVHSPAWEPEKAPLREPQRRPQSAMHHTASTHIMREPDDGYGHRDYHKPPEQVIPKKVFSHLNQDFQLELQGRTVPVSGDELLEFCDGTLNGMKQALKELEEYKKNLDSLRETANLHTAEREKRLQSELTLKQREVEILKQQVGDLEMLVKVMDGKIAQKSA